MQVDSLFPNITNEVKRKCVDLIFRLKFFSIYLQKNDFVFQSSCLILSIVHFSSLYIFSKSLGGHPLEKIYLVFQSYRLISEFWVFLCFYVDKGIGNCYLKQSNSWDGCEHVHALFVSLPMSSYMFWFSGLFVWR